MSAGTPTSIWRAATLVLLGTAMACGDTKSGPNTPLSIQFNPPQLPSMVVGEELHDTLGNIDSLHATVFNSTGDTIQDAPTRYVHADTTRIITIDSVSGHVMANDTGFARVVAQAASLQSPPETLFVVERPDAFTNITPLNDTLAFTPVRTDTLFPLSVALKSAGTPVNHYRIEYSFIYPAGLNVADSTRVLLSDENKKFSLVDTTGTAATAVAGAATRYLRITPFTHLTTDTVVVEARAFLPDHTPVPGSPLRFTVLVQIQ
ncbi:MAG: hypothetical protein JJD97_08190 [Gemmatimonadaceae bacterium]|nr:hypothetical protein [Gemmatimonadaceae bacterium]